jgi:hypothetical protein
MKYLYKVKYLKFLPGYNADEEQSVSIIDKNGNLGERALLNRVEKEHGFRPGRITRIECMCYAN